jgi:hypothetical protein
MFVVRGCSWAWRVTARSNDQYVGEWLHTRRR